MPFDKLRAHNALRQAQGTYPLRPTTPTQGAECKGEFHEL